MAEREQIKRQAPSRTEEETVDEVPTTSKKGEELKAELDTMDWNDARAWNLVRRQIDHLNEAGPAASIAAAQSGGKLH